MIWDRLGVITDEVAPELIEALDWIQGEQLKHVEIRMVDGVNVMELTVAQVERIKRETDSRGLFVSAVSSPLFKCLLDPARPLRTGDQFGQAEKTAEEHHAMLPLAIDYAKRLGTRYIRIFSFWREENPSLHTEEIVAHLRRAAETAEREDVVLLLENEHSCNGGFASEVAALVRAVDSPALKVLWDPGNEHRHSPSFPKGYNHVRDLQVHFHLKYWYVALGEEPLLPQLEALEKDGFTGLFTIETHYSPEGGTRKDGTKLTLKLLRDMLP
ncbi:sugar phosphate isomerase/epimerase family protein [Paenibacillus koleovorans]|uniref:sugar phosphate isomerase/epimerase family protein n=1 Tax=Paenibacillus koleovorans TaxID=121608 RepID=UPI0013E37BD0|nr:sugar phosphate isomerase/epimerase family protein [Paenibacillus koleovorans]